MTPDEWSALLQPASQTWLRSHRHADPVQVAMDRKLDPALPRRALAEQLRCQHKLRRKLPAWVDAGCLFTPQATEQASHHALARYRARRLSGRVWDLAAGLGADAAAAAQAGCDVTVCERDPTLGQMLEHNARALNLDWTVQVGDGPVLAIAALNQNPTSIDTCLLDPDRRPATVSTRGQSRTEPRDHQARSDQQSGERRRTIRLQDIRPDPSHWWPQLAKAGLPRCLLKLAPACPAAEVRALPGCTELAWISHGGECRELLAECLRHPPADSNPAPRLRAIGIDHHGDELFTIEGPAQPLERTAEHALNWIIEPDPAVIRSGLVGNLAAQLDLQAVHPQVALLTSTQHPQHPALTAWQVLAQGIYERKALRRVLQQHNIEHLTISARHFPHQPQIIAQQLKVRTGGGRHRLVCWRAPNSQLRYALGQSAEGGH